MLKKSLIILVIVTLLVSGVWVVYKNRSTLKLAGGETETQYSESKQATVLVQDASYYGPPFDKDLYQLEVDRSIHFFAKSKAVDLSKYMGKWITINYRDEINHIEGEQQFVVVDSIVKEN